MDLMSSLSLSMAVMKRATGQRSYHPWTVSEPTYLSDEFAGVALVILDGDGPVLLDPGQKMLKT